MANYWLKRSPAAQVEGPFTGTQLKQMAASGQIAATALLSGDQARWTTASKVKGLFPEPAAARQPPPPAEAPEPQSDTYDLVEEPTPPVSSVPAAAPVAVQPLAYATGLAPPPRNVQWYLVCASILLVIGIGYRVLDFAYSAGSSFTNTYSMTRRSVVPGRFASARTRASRTSPANAAILLLAGATALLLLGGAFGLYVYFTIWAYLAHRDFQQFTNGAYPIGPARACGFCWIPLFHFFWLVYMPYKLAQAVEWHLGPGRPIVKPNNIVALQVGSTIACCCVQGLPNFLLASTVKQIQTGMNDLWLNPIQVPGRGW